MSTRSSSCYEITNDGPSRLGPQSVDQTMRPLPAPGAASSARLSAPTNRTHMSTIGRILRLRIIRATLGATALMAMTGRHHLPQIGDAL